MLVFIAKCFGFFFSQEINAFIAFIAQWLGFFFPRNKCIYCLYCNVCCCCFFFPQEINAYFAFLAKWWFWVFFPQEINALIAFIAKCFFTPRSKCTSCLYCNEFFPKK